MNMFPAILTGALGGSTSEPDTFTEGHGKAWGVEADRGSDGESCHGCRLRDDWNWAAALDQQVWQ